MCCYLIFLIFDKPAWIGRYYVLFVAGISGHVNYAALLIMFAELLIYGVPVSCSFIFRLHSEYQLLTKENPNELFAEQE